MAATAPPSWAVIPAGEAARRSPNSSVPSRTPDIGSTVSITGRLAASAPAWKALAESSSPAAPSASSAQGCQWASVAPRPTARSSLVRLSVTAAVRPNTAPAAAAVTAARTGPVAGLPAGVVASLPAASASAQTSPTTAKASSQSRAGASDLPGDGGAAARNAAIPPAARTQPSQSLPRSGRDHRAATGSAKSRSVATIGATSASGPNASARACRP